ncbi:MAG TPA: hypothetical protein VLM76_13765, partial [Patescibacteria group bacterium]|nr:hypothetical protein [Patescibacteria group bacterium]
MTPAELAVDPRETDRDWTGKGPGLAPGSGALHRASPACHTIVQMTRRILLVEDDPSIRELTGMG